VYKVYYQTQYDHSLPPDTPFGYYVSPLPLISVITHLILAAFHLNANLPIKLALNDNAPDEPYYEQMWKDIAQMQQTGIKVIGMLGGAAPGSYDCLTPYNFNTFYPLLRDAIRTYKLDGMDLDVEQAVSLKDITHLITQLKADFGPDFIITLAPVASALEEGANISGFDYIQLEKVAGSQIAWYNAQFYSGFGSVFPDDQYIDIVQFGYGLDPSRLVATTLTNPDDGFGYVDPYEVVSSLQALVDKFGGEFGGVAGWEYFNSLPSQGKPWEWATLMTNTMKDIEAKLAANETVKRPSNETVTKRLQRSRVFRPVPIDRKRSFASLKSRTVAVGAS